jgi:hypothetical protein
MALTIVIYLPPKTPLTVQMLVPGISCWLIDKSIACLNYLIEKVGALVTPRRRTHPEGLIEQTDLRLRKDAGTESSIGS